MNVTTQGDSNSVTLVAQCLAPITNDTVTITFATNKPDQVKLNSRTAFVAQNQSGNFADVNVTGAGTQNFDVDLTCTRVTLRGSVNDDQARGKGQGSAKNCTASLTFDQTAFVVLVCSGSPTVRGKIDGETGTLKNVSVQISGPIP